jgi:hypothetical protein
MTRVFVLLMDEDYNNEMVMGTYTTMEKAENTLKREKKDNPGRPFRIENHLLE